MLVSSATAARAAQRRGAEVVKPDRDAHMRVRGANAVGRVESDPAELRDKRLAPGMAGILLGDAGVLAQISAHVAGRNADAARRRYEDVRQILADAALERESLGRGGRGMGGIRIEGHRLVQSLEQDVEKFQRIIVGLVAAGSGKGGDVGIGAGERGLAQVKRGGKPLERAAHNPVGIAGLDLAFHGYAELVERAVGGKGVGDVAEGILMLVEPAIR